MNFVKSRDSYDCTDVSRTHGQYQSPNYQGFNSPGFNQGQQRLNRPQSGPWQQCFNGPQGLINHQPYLSGNSSGFNGHQQDFFSQDGIESYQQNRPLQGFGGYNQQNLGNFQQQGYNGPQDNFSSKQQGAMARRRYQGPQPKRNSLSESSHGSSRPRQQLSGSLQRFSRPQQGNGQYSSFVKAVNADNDNAGEDGSFSGPSSASQVKHGGFEKPGIASSKGRGGGGKNHNDDFAAVAAVTALAAQATQAAVNPDARCVWLSNQGYFISKVQRLAMQVKSLRSERPNAVDQLHSAANKVRINIHSEIESGPVVKSTYTFFCLVQFDGVNVAVASALNKRAAKVEAYDAALKKIMMPFLRVVEINGTSKELQSSNVEFSSEPVKQTVIKPTSAVVKGICGEEKTSGPSKRNSLQKESNAESIIHAKKKNYAAKDLNDFLLVEPIEHNSSVNGASILRRSADYSKMLLEYEFAAQPGSTGAIRCIVTVEGHILADIVASSKPAAKIRASEVAVDVLRQHCWTILTKQHHDTDAPEITKEEMFSELADSAASFAASGGAGAASSNAASMNVAIPDSNLGKKMLQKMGWTGGGIGKDGTGIEEPVSMQKVINREGLGLSTAKGVTGEFRARIVDMLEGYASSDRQEDLVFSPTFHKEERMIIHCECRRLNLKSTSKGQGPDRFLIVRRKRSAFQLIDHIMANGGETARYKLVPPGQRKYPWQKIPHVTKVGMPWPDTKHKGVGGRTVAGQNLDPSSNPAWNPNPNFNSRMNPNTGYNPNPAGGFKQETILTKQHHDTDPPEITKEEMFSELDDSAASFAARGGTGAASSNAASMNVAIPDSNLGKKMLQKMGWTGGGIGKDGTGIEEPVSMQKVISRKGMGLSPAKGVTGKCKYPRQKISNVTKVSMPWPDTKHKGGEGCAVAGQNLDPNSNPAWNPNPNFNPRINPNTGYNLNPAGGFKQETGLLGSKPAPLMSLPMMGPFGAMGGPGPGMLGPAFNRH